MQTKTIKHKGRLVKTFYTFLTDFEEAIKDGWELGEPNSANSKFSVNGAGYISITLTKDGEVVTSEPAEEASEAVYVSPRHPILVDLDKLTTKAEVLEWAASKGVTVPEDKKWVSQIKKYLEGIIPVREDTIE